MKRKAVLRIVLPAFLICMLTFTFNIRAIKAEPTTIIVPVDYSTIKEAIRAASPGDTIVVREGLYAEGSISISKPLTLIAEGTVIVDGLQKATDVFSVASNNVVIKGFIVKNAQHAGILLFHADNCRIEANTVENNHVGIWIGFWSHDNLVKGNKVLNNKFGIYLDGICSYTHHNVIEENIAENNSYAIDLIHTHHNVIRQNTLNDNKNASIILSFSDYNTIRENEVTNTDQIGIALLVSHFNIIKENKVANNGLGIGLSGSGWNTVEENEVNRNTPYHGIALYWSYARNTIKENVALGNEEFDLYWNGEGYNTWTENKYKTRNW